MDEGIRVLHVDDDPDFLEVTAAYLERDGRFVVETATGGAVGLETLTRDVDCVVSDYEMPDMDGIEFLDAVRETYPDLPFLLFTGKGSEEIASDAVSAGVTDYLRKRPGTEQYDLLVSRIQTAVGQYRAERELERQNRLLEEEVQRRSMAERRYRSLFEHFPEPTIAYTYRDGEPHVARVNEAFTDVFGYTSEGAVGEHIDDLVVPPERQESARRLDDRVRAGDALDRELRRQAADGLREFRFRNIRLEEDTEIDGYAVYADITERRERERELERYATIVEASGDPVYTLDEDGCFTFVNEALLEMTGYDEADLLGSHFSAFLVREDKERGGTVIRSLRFSGWNRRTTELTVVRKDATRVPCEIHVTPLPYDEHFRGVVGVIRDITERVERERELERKNERLEEFASVISHDLQNPLTVLSGALELAEETGEADHFQRCHRAIDRMVGLIDELLALAREGEDIEETRPVSLAEIAEACWRTVATADATLAVETNRVVRADRIRLRQLFENLLRNAVEHGGSDVSVEVGDLPGGFYVADDGSGIPADERERIFDVGYSTAQQGTGFGLNIVREIVDAHGWSVAVTDSEDGGARFDITGVDIVE